MPRFRFSLIAIPRVVTLAMCVFIPSCSFHSVQLDLLTELLQERFANTKRISPSKVYWWDFNYANNTYRLFPVDWRGATALTDGKRWIVALQGTRIRLVRDLVARRDLEFSFQTAIKQFESSDLVDGRQSGDSNEGDRYTEIVRMSSVSSGQIVLSPSKIMKCSTPIFDDQKLRRVTFCIDEDAERFGFNEVEFNRNQEILRIIQSVGERDRVELLRSSTIVSEEDLEIFLNT